MFTQAFPAGLELPAGFFFFPNVQEERKGGCRGLLG